MEEVHLFYSWQSDRENKLCREFIWRALEEAAAAINENGRYALRLDRDTAGVAGTPPVTDTILAKIRVCDIFLCDMTFVGVADTDSSKLIPNPNMMAEYGFARALKSPGRLQLVMNTAFGLPSALPFDMRTMRYPTTYSVASDTPDGVRRAARRTLANELVSYLRLSIEEVLAERRLAEPATDKVRQADGVIADLDALTHRQDVPAIVSNPRLRVRLMPFEALSEPEFDLALIKQLRPTFVPAGFASERRSDHTDGWQWASYDPPRRVDGLPNPEGRWLVRIVKPGILEAAITIGTQVDDDPTIVVRGHQLEARVVDAVETLARLANAIGLGGAARVAIAMHGVGDVQVSGSRSTGRAIGYPDVTLGSASLPDMRNISARSLKPMLDQLWLLSGWDEGSPSFGNGDWSGSNGGEAYML